MGRLVGAFALVALILVAGANLFAAFSAFTGEKYTLVDYGKYVNAIWNCGHGEFFRQLTEYNYLNSHLSFSLALLGPVFLLADHPFTLAVLQWLLCLGGILIMLRTASRSGVPFDVSIIFLLAYLVSPFTQSVLLSEFHGVSLYLFVLPWLYHSLAFQRPFAVIPLLLLLGVREEAGLLALPMLLYFAIRDRWRGGFVLAALTAAYCGLACTVLFEWINGFTLADRRPGVSAGGVFEQLLKQPASWRLIPLAWLLLPVLPFLRKGWLAIFIFPSVAIITSLLSPYKPQFTFANHYAAASQILLFLGILHALRQGGRRKAVLVDPVLRMQVISLLAACLISHWQLGFLPGGHRQQKVYWGINPNGLAILRAAAKVPKEGILLTDSVLAGFSANRRDLITWEQYETGRFMPDAVFTTLKLLRGKQEDPLWQEVRAGKFGMAWFDGVYAVLVRGQASEERALLMRAVEEYPFTVRFAYTSNRAGSEEFWRDGSLIRYWDGKGEKNLLSYGSVISLEAGTYAAEFHLQSASTCPGAGNDCGRLYLMRKGQRDPWLEEPIAAVAPEADGFFRQRILFSTDKPVIIEPRVTGGPEPLWLSRVIVRRLEQPEG